MTRDVESTDENSRGLAWPIFKSPWAWWEQTERVLCGVCQSTKMQDKDTVPVVTCELSQMNLEMGRHPDVNTQGIRQRREVPGHHGDGKFPTHV